jgi:hypothetical protein
MIGLSMNNELEMIQKWLWPNLKYYPGTCLEGPRKTMKNLAG